MNLTKKEKFSFGFGALGKDAICCFVGNFLMFYFTDVLFLAPAFVGTLFFVARIWDAINDPMMGLVVDNTHNRFGKFRTWLLVGTLLNAVVFFAMFNTFGLHGKALYIYVSIAYILYGMTYTIMDVPYWSWLPNLTNDPHERESVSVIPRFFASLAGFSIGVFGLSMINGMDKIFGNGDRTAGFRMVALVISILFVFTISVTIINVKEKVTEKAAEHTSFKQIINILFKNKSAAMINKPPSKNPILTHNQLIIFNSSACSMAGFNNEKKLADIIIPAPNAKKQSNNFFETFFYTLICQTV